MPGVICFQEMDKDQFYFEELTKLGYDGTLYKRPSYFDYREGIAIFAQHKQF